MSDNSPPKTQNNTINTPKPAEKPKNRLMESFIGANPWQKTNDNEKILGKDSFIAEYSDFKSVRQKNWLMDNFYGVAWQYKNIHITIENIMEYYGSFANYRVGVQLQVDNFAGNFYMNLNEFLPYLKLMVYPADILQQTPAYIGHGLEIIIRKILPAGVNILGITLDSPPENYENIYLANMVIDYNKANFAPKKLKILIQSEQMENWAEFLKIQSNFTQFQSNHCEGLLFECNLFCGHATITLNELQNLAVGDVILFSQELKFS